MVGIVADKRVGALEDFPQPRQVFFEERIVRIGCGIVDAADGHLDVVVDARARAEIADCFDVEGYDSHRTPDYTKWKGRCEGGLLSATGALPKASG